MLTFPHTNTVNNQIKETEQESEKINGVKNEQGYFLMSYEFV